MFLHLDNTFKPFQGPEIQFESFYFSGGEPHIKLKPYQHDGHVTITHRINSFNDLGTLLVAVDALRRSGSKSLSLFIPYFPGARQDRVMVEGEALTVKVYAELINTLKLEQVTIFDPHSEVAPALLDNCRVLNNHTYIAQILADLPKDLILISPDGGALKKIHKLAAYLQDYDVVECGKTRDVRTGKLSGFHVPTNDLQNRDCLIVDDICDGGGTFMGLANELKASQAGHLFLAVSHGIFSKGTEALEDVFDTIYTTDSVKNISTSGIQCISLKNIPHEQ